MIRYLNIVTILLSVLSATFLILGGFPKLIFQIPVNEGAAVFLTSGLASFVPYA